MYYAYLNGKATQDRIVSQLAKSSGFHLLHSRHFIKNGIPPKAKKVMFAGITNGNAELYRRCVKYGIEFYYIDHAYFNAGYAKPTWMRITKNGFVQNQTWSVSNTRYARCSASETTVQKINYAQNRKILILPPTYATANVFWVDVDKWVNEKVEQVRQIVDWPIEIRHKPHQLLVDTWGNPIGRTEKIKQKPLREEFSDTYCVIAYNSNATVDAVTANIPVITDQNCATWPVSNDIKDLLNLKLPAGAKKTELFNSLGHGQYNLSEMRTGHAWRSLQNLPEQYKLQ